MSTPGETSIGPYGISKEIGRGGMGVVYLARDARLDRDVAIKALPEELSEDVDRLERFEREARSLAQLNHPNVAGIYGIEEQGGRRYLVLEYVAGETLADRIDHGPMLLDDALDIAIHVAAGVEAAHEAGIIHRDLKPANIIITPDGVAKVLDFGLARTDDSGTALSSTQLTTPGSADSPTRSVSPNSPTVPGVLLGTAPYMSPEQARGRRLDRRTDIWSFGVILYEMLTGQSPFQGETATDSIGAILHKDVDLELLPPGTPPMVRHVLQRCLERDKDRRYRDIGDVRIELATAGNTAGAHALAAASSAPARARRVPVGLMAGLVLPIALAGAAAAWLVKPAPTPAPDAVAHLSLVLPWDRNLVDEHAISPDGQTLAFVVREGMPGATEWGVYTRRLDRVDYDLLHTTRDEPIGFMFTPDGQDLILAEASASGRQSIVRVAVADGRTLLLLDDDDNRLDLESTRNRWLNDDEFLVREAGDVVRTIHAVSRSDGSVRPAFELPEDIPWSFLSSVSPDGRRVLLGSWTVASDAFERNLTLIDLETGASSPVMDQVNVGVFLAPDRIAVLRGAQRFSTRIDPATGAPLGAFVPLAAPASNTGVRVALDAGHLTYFTERDAVGQISLMDREGNSSTLVGEPRWYRGAPQVSLDGELVAAVYTERAIDSQSILTVLNVTSGRSQVAARGTLAMSQWLADGRFLFIMNPNASEDDPPVIFADVMSWHPDRGTETLLSQYPLPRPQVTGTPDGSVLVALTRPREAARPPGLPDGDDDFLALVDPSQPGRAPAFYYSGGGREDNPQLSPDGRMLAFSSETNGSPGVFVTWFTPGEPPQPIRVSNTEAKSMFWSPDGSELFFHTERPGIDGEVLMRVGITADESIQVTEPTQILDPATFDEDRATPWVDGERFLYIDLPDPRPQDEHLHVVLNWLDHARRSLDD